MSETVNAETDDYEISDVLLTQSKAEVQNTKENKSVEGERCLY